MRIRVNLIVITNCDMGINETLKGNNLRRI